MLLTKPKEATSLRRTLATLQTDGPSRMFAALGDPIRLRIAILLCIKKDICVTDLTELLTIPQPLVSHHLRVLREAGVVVVQRMGRIQCPRLANDQIKRMVMKFIMSERR
ncbi:MAG: winged helix-turn-helix transcriptional regulator [Candidatus Kerfeldbacteria bacterium]|nr:winged helix-turn-helix transcriptional regulator [Candidatus Kerfeldbacteria bacterium]